MSDLDDYAIRELRAQGLLWSSEVIRPTATSLINNFSVVEFSCQNKIRRFFLSILWRAAVSSLPEFDEIYLPDNKVEKLRRIILGEIDDEQSFFPYCYSTVGRKGAST